MEQSAMLVRKEDVERYIQELITSETEIVQDLKRVLPHVQGATVRKSLKLRLSRGEECLKALQEGFIPLDSGYFTRVDVKDKWRQTEVKKTLTSMPPEVKEVWEHIKEKGIFKAFAVTTATGGDPILVGRTGGKNFFIAGWLDFGRGISLGIRVKV